MDGCGECLEKWSWGYKFFKIEVKGGKKWMKIYH